jgi:pantothenate kinase
LDHGGQSLIAASSPAVSALIDLILEKTNQDGRKRRYMVGITGSPGSGKSTLSALLVDEVNKRARKNICALVPMDGFHMRNKKLIELGLRDLKGIPDTFEAQSFVDMLGELAAVPMKTVLCPAFDRTIEEPVENAIEVSTEHSVLVIEGNYLLLQKSPWNKVRPLLDEVWFIAADEDVILPRLIERHVAGGKTTDGAREKVNSTDLPNARLIEATRQLADRVITDL